MALTALCKCRLKNCPSTRPDLAMYRPAAGSSPTSDAACTMFKSTVAYTREKPLYKNDAKSRLKNFIFVRRTGTQKVWCISKTKCAIDQMTFCQ